MALFAMPLVIINMGGEMMYILEQRLQAQSIPVEKSRRVLTDVVKTMYGQKFIDELFKPQPVYTTQSTRQIFEKLAHASIMRLNENSMDKLYDLMTMGFKHQVLGCVSPVHLLQVTLNHLEAMKRTVDNSAVQDLIERAERMTIDTYSTLSVGEFFALKHVLARFFQDRRVKVSLFLQDAIQNLDGTMVIQRTGSLPPGTEAAGVIRYFTPGGGRKDSARVPELEIDGVLPPSTGSALDPDTRPCQLGTNMYARERKAAGGVKPKPGPNNRHKKTSSSSAAASSPPKAARESKEAEAAPSPPSGAASGSGGGATSGPAYGTAGLSLLAGLVGGAGATTAPSTADGFRLNLFPGDDAISGSSGGGSRPYEMITIDATDRETMQEMMDKLGFDEGGGGGGGGEGKEVEEDDDDLLSLMDRAK